MRQISVILLLVLLTGCGISVSVGTVLPPVPSGSDLGANGDEAPISLTEPGFQLPPIAAQQAQVIAMPMVTYTGASN